MYLRSLITNLSRIAGRRVTVEGQAPAKPIQVGAHPPYASSINSFRALLDVPATFLRMLAAGANGHKVGQLVNDADDTDNANTVARVDHSTKSLDNTKCSLCGLNFTTSAYLAAHFKHRHGDCGMNARTHKCTECTSAFRMAATLRTHVRHVHEGYKGAHVCTTCTAAFQSRAHLVRHARKHTGERPYACTLCNGVVAFAQTGQLRVHTRSQHTRERPYQCEQCAIVFAVSGQLRAHTAHTVHVPAACA